MPNSGTPNLPSILDDMIEKEQLTAEKTTVRASLLIGLTDEDRPLDQIHRRVTAQYIRPSVLHLALDRPTIIEGQRVSELLATRLTYTSDNEIAKQPNRKVLLSLTTEQQPRESIIGIVVYDSWHEPESEDYFHDLIKDLLNLRKP